MNTALFVFGTRPEAIKLAPLIARFRQSGCFRPVVCATGQHRELLADALGCFEITPDHDLGAMRPGQCLSATAGRILCDLQETIERVNPRFTVVQGDTTSTFCGSLASFYAGVPVAHVEAGLRTGDLHAPFPEEMHRVLTARLAALHFAATPRAAENLRHEGIRPGRILVTGNTGVDALLSVCDGLESGRLRPSRRVEAPPGKRLVVVTAHRRESFGGGLLRLCDVLRRLGARPDVQLVCCVHPNPSVRQVFEERLGGQPGVQLESPLDYVSFVDLLRRAELILTDSGGIQEEAPSLDKPVLVLREVTERQEVVESGSAVLVGCSPDKVMQEAERLLDDPEERRRRTGMHNPFGDGRACERIERRLLERFERPRLAAAG